MDRYCPFNNARPINSFAGPSKGIVARYIPGIPSFGGNKLPDLCYQHPAAFQGTGSPIWSSANAPPGGYGSLKFDGSTQWANTNWSPPGLGLTNFGFSLSMWVYNACQITRGFDNPPTFSSGWAWYLSSVSGKAEFSIVLTSGGGAAFTATGTTVLAANTWYRITGSWYPGGNVTIAVNGILEATTNVTALNMRNNGTNQIGLMRNNNFVSGAFTTYGGSLGEVTFYQSLVANNTLSVAQDRANYIDAINGYPSLNRLQSQNAWLSAAANPPPVIGSGAAMLLLM